MMQSAFFINAHMGKLWSMRWDFRSSVLNLYIRRCCAGYFFVGKAKEGGDAAVRAKHVPLAYSTVHRRQRDSIGTYISRFACIYMCQNQLFTGKI